MHHKIATGAQREPSPSQGVNVIKPASPLPPKPLSSATIERIRQTSVGQHSVTPPKK